MTEEDSAARATFAGECRIRDLYAERLSEFRKEERLVKTEYSFADSKVRADMRTIDSEDVLRMWEFKIFGGYEGLGQALTYLALARRGVEFKRPVKGVLAAFEFHPDVSDSVEILNLGIELVVIPPKLRLAGGIPAIDSPPPSPSIPNLADLSRGSTPSKET